MLAMKTWTCLIVIATGALLHADDWPTFRHDNHRSGRTADTLPAKSLQQQWVWRSAAPPQPAWAGPAKWDAYHNIKLLRSMRNYDPVFHVVVAGGSVYFGSSVDDSVHCLDAATGKEKWSYTTDAPVRIAPSFAGGKLYFGSDDGFAYCLAAGDGSLVWRYSPAPAARRILNNGRLISPWPCRTGVLVDGRTAYFATGMLPWKKSYLCAVDAETGKPEGPARYARELSGMTMEGALLASANRLFAPQGRVPPLLFDRAGGKSLGPLGKKGGGGCFVLLTDDAHLLHGPGNKAGWITDSNAVTRARVASFNGGNAMVVAGGTAYVLTDHSLAALDRSTRKPKWSKPCEYPYELIVAGETLFAGGRDAVAAFSAKDGTLLWKGKVAGKAYGLAAAAGRLLVSTGEGAIYCFQPGPKPASATKPGQSPPAPEKMEPLALALGPYLQFTGPDSAIVRWQTREPTTTRLDYGVAGELQSVEDAALKTKHEVTLADLRKDTVYSYFIFGKRARAGPFECDTFFNYSPATVPPRPSPYPKDKAALLYSQAAEQILSATGARRGICLVLGSSDGRLAYELAKRSGLRVIGVETDAGAVAAARRALKAAGIYGARVAIHHADSLARLPFVGSFANLIVSDRGLTTGECVGTAAEVARLLRPGGGVAYLGQPEAAPKKLSKEKLDAWFKADSLRAEIRQDKEGFCARLVRPPLKNAGVWSHQYGRADNSAFGGESLAGARSTDQLEVQWVGRPGPRAQADRNGRKPSPLSTGGRLFMQGLHRIIAIDAYNGIILWSVEIPDMQRMNVPRDSANWCADEDYLFMAVKDRCWRFDAADGILSKTYEVVDGPKRDWRYDWSYVASCGELLLGSAVKQGTAYTNFWGRSGWYDAPHGPEACKVCSENLFAIEKGSARKRWEYADGLVINSTITIGAGRVYFVQSRNPKVKASDSRRVGMGELWQDQFLTCLDVASGKKVWEKPIDTHDGISVFYLAYANQRLVIVSSGGGAFHVYAYAAADGKPLWNNRFGWPGGKHDHGKAMSRPAIVGNTLYVRPRAFDLATGKVLPRSLPGGGCGTYACSTHAVFFRAGTVQMWDRETAKATTWSRLRPGCWLSTIPAAGMLLSPEAGGGCSCGSWMETSVGFIPKGEQ